MKASIFVILSSSDFHFATYFAPRISLSAFVISLAASASYRRVRAADTNSFSKIRVRSSRLLFSSSLFGIVLDKLALVKRTEEDSVGLEWHLSAQW